MATVEPEELKKKTKMVAYDTLSLLSIFILKVTNFTKLFGKYKHNIPLQHEK